MKKLFDIVQGEVVMNASSLWIPEFRRIWDRDKDEHKRNAHREITYIVFMYDFSSPYNSYNEKEREDRIIKDYFEVTPTDKLKSIKWKPDKLVKAAIQKFNELQETPTLRLLRAVKKSMQIVTDFFQEAEPSDINNIMKHTEKIGQLVKSIELLTKQVEKEMSETSSVRGGQGIGMFEL